MDACKYPLNSLCYSRLEEEFSNRQGKNVNIFVYKYVIFFV